MAACHSDTCPGCVRAFSEADCRGIQPTQRIRFFPGGKVTLSQELDLVKASAEAAEAETEAEGTGTSRDAKRNRFENLVTPNPVQALIELR
jgi:hypothetical protein